MTETRRRRAWVATGLLLAPSLVAFAGFFVLPLLHMLLLSFYRFDRSVGLVEQLGLQNYAKFLGDAFYLGVLGRTLRVAAITTALTVVVGYPVACYAARARPRRRATLLLVVLAPLLVSVVVRTFGWLVILGPNGFINVGLRALRITTDPVPLMYTEGAIVLGLVHVFLPFMVLSVLASLQTIDPAVLRAARNLGASAAYAFRRVTLPLSLPGIAAGTLIVFSLSSSAFITPALLGGARVKVMSYLAYQQTLMLSDWPFGAAIAFILLAIAGAAVVGYVRMLERGRFGIVFH